MINLNFSAEASSAKKGAKVSSTLTLLHQIVASGVEVVLPPQKGPSRPALITVVLEQQPTVNESLNSPILSFRASTSCTSHANSQLRNA